MRRAVVALLGAFALGGGTPSQDPNMNGEYILSATPNAPNTSAFPTNYRDYPGGLEYFEVYSNPIKTLYSQVYWTRQPAVKLPQEIIDRFAGKTMAVFGFELDQVRRTPDGDVSVPISVSYNHHFESTMTGSNAQWEKVSWDDPRAPQMGHKHLDDFAWIVTKKDPSISAPAHQDFGAANGGEVRKSFHGYAPGFAQFIDSPQELSITPMQIDTWNRDHMNITGGPFVPGPVPRSSLAPTSGPDAIYSGLLECPVTTRIEKLVKCDYSIQAQGLCDSPISNEGECWAATAKLFPDQAGHIKQTVSSDDTLPAGCLASVDKGAVFANFNSPKTTTPPHCGGQNGKAYGSASSLIDFDVTLDPSAQVATITLTGPSSVWHGVGFNASAMAQEPWTLIVDGTGAVSERKLANHLQGTQLKPSVKVLSSVVKDGARTTVLQRALAGADADYFTFDSTQDVSLPFIVAIGSGPDFAYHANRTSGSIQILPQDLPICICADEPPPFGQASGSLKYESTVIGFNNHCPAPPRCDLLAQKNPTCDVRTYAGGQIACHHMWSLLDADQDIPWQDQPLEFQMKFRFWFKEIASESPPTSRVPQEVIRDTWGMASPVEYDVPQCPKGTPTAECIHTITALFSVSKPAKGKQRKLVAAHFHCHAPTCLEVTVWNNRTGEMICRERPIYGGTGVIAEHKFDEPGYIAQPPCLWGDVAHGLEAPPVVGGELLYAVKHSNSTYGHHGEMAWLQVFMVDEEESQ